MDPNLVFTQIAIRVSEMNMWILIRNLGWFLFVLTAIGLVILIITWKPKELVLWILLGSIPIFWMGFEAVSAYYLHLNGAQVRHLEEQLPEDIRKHAHEHQRIEHPTIANNLAFLGYALPFLCLLGFVFTKLVKEFREQNGILWIIVVLGIGLITTLVFYLWLISKAKGG